VFATNRLDVLRATFFVAGRQNEPSENRQGLALPDPFSTLVRCPLMDMISCYFTLFARSIDYLTILGRVEQTAESTGNHAVQNESVALPASSAITDPDLFKVIEAWPKLPLDCQKAILAIVGSVDIGK